MKSLDIIQPQIARMLSPEMQAQVRNLQWRIALWRNGCIGNDQQSDDLDTSDIVPRAEFSRSRVYTGIGDAGTYNHHSALAAFGGRYAFAWTNGFVDEDKPGQRTMISWSEDAQTWSPAQCVVPAEADAGEVQQTGGLMPWDDRLILYYITRYAADPAAPKAGTYDEGAAHLNMAVSNDGQSWEHHRHIIDGPVWMFEAPRLTRAGTLLAPGALDGPVVFRWPADAPISTPEIIRLDPIYDGRYVFGEASWYQTDDGRIFIFWREEAGSLCIPVSVSDDDGKTWLGPMLSDFPDTVARARAGRLRDGRFFIIGNSYPDLLNRSRLILSLSDDGYKFDRMVTLVDEPTRQRSRGLLKVHGYQYPTSLVDGDRLLVGYSVNKEDIECGVLDATGLA